MKRLQGKIALVTGASSGIGCATAKRFANEGAYVFITGRRKEELDKAKALIGANVTAVQGDVSKSEDLERLFEAIKAEKGRLDVIFANAGAGEFFPFGTITEEEFDRSIGVNLKGVLFTVQGALPLLSDGASIIINGSMAGSMGIPGFTTYSAAKAGVRSFARTWAAELKGRGIRTNVVSPGPIMTPPLVNAGQEAIDSFTSGVPLGRAGEPEEVAAVALFLASNESSFVNGSEYFADGGAAQV